MKIIDYNEKLHGKFNYPNGFAEMLKGNSVEDQMRFFRIGNGMYTKKQFFERKKNKYDYSCNLKEENRVEAVIVCDGLIAGVLVRNCYGEIVPCLPEKSFIIRDDEEFDGSGYKSFQLFLYLICVNEDFDNTR